MIPTKKNIEKVARDEVYDLIRSMGVNNMSSDISSLLVFSKDQRSDTYTLTLSLHDLMLELGKAERRIHDLESKFDAINKHYGIEVEAQEAQYVVKDV